MQYASARATVSVPATSANLGPGFDSIGLALDVRDTITAEAMASSQVAIAITGEGEASLPTDERHLVVRALRQTQEILGLPQTGLSLEAHNRIPQGKGMGSSASAIVAGVSIGLAFSGRTDLGKDFIFDIAAQMEGHPDNVAPAVFGGLTASWKFDPEVDVPSSVLDSGSRPPLPQNLEGYTPGYHTVKYPVDGSIHATMFLPQEELPTETARTILPDRLPYSDALRNIARAAALPAILGQRPTEQTNAELFNVTADRLHQDYRKDLYTDSWQLMTHLRSRGYAAVISGAGPCVLALHSGDDDAALRAYAEQEWLSTGRWEMRAVGIDTRGVEISKEELR